MEGRFESYVPWSPQGVEVKDLVRCAIPQRKPVGYYRAFLEGYEPNRSGYLPDSRCAAICTGWVARL